MDPAASLGEVERIYSAHVESIAAGQTQPVYAMNFSGKLSTLPSVLEKVPLHISPELNEDIDRSPGINEPSYYLSGALSFSEINPEDGYLDSCNIVDWGETGAEKI